MNILALILQTIKAGQVITNGVKLNKAIQIAKLLNTSPQVLLNEILLEPEKVSIRLGQLGVEGRKELRQAIAEEQQASGTDASPLSSSWLIAGVFQSATPMGLAGNLTLTMKNGKSYTYPSVDRATWEAMKGATGQNGSGAGSVFWTFYLGSAKQLATFQYFGVATGR